MKLSKHNQKMKILLVEDDPAHRKVILDVLRDQFDVSSAACYDLAVTNLKQTKFDLVFLDLMLPESNSSEVVKDGSLGYKLLKLIRQVEPLCPVVIVSGLQSIRTAVDLMLLGIADYVVKDQIEEQLPLILLRAEQARQGQIDQLLLRRFQSDRTSGKFVYADKSMRLIDEKIDMLARNDSTALLLGETGTGKDVIAKEIHRRSSRCKGPFIAINCASIPEKLFESEMFGSEKGAFSGAETTKVGYLEIANHGTLFLDEIADLSEENQKKFLRFLNSKELQRLGSTKVIRVDVRVISATNKDFSYEISERHFRRDLYERLVRHIIRIPPLRTRLADIPVLVSHILSQSLTGSTLKFTPKAMKELRRYDWQGNVRELDNVLYRIIDDATSDVVVTNSTTASTIATAPAA